MSVEVALMLLNRPSKDFKSGCWICGVTERILVANWKIQSYGLYFLAQFFWDFSLLMHLAIFRNASDEATLVLVLSTSILYYQK